MDTNFVAAKPPRESPHVTAGTVLVDEHYRQLGLFSGWNNDRLNRLCEMYRATPHEIGRLCCVFNGIPSTNPRPSFALMQTMIRNDHFPPCVSLHFALLERCYLEEVHGKIGEPLMPLGLIGKREAVAV